MKFSNLIQLKDLKKIQLQLTMLYYHVDDLFSHSFFVYLK